MTKLVLRCIKNLELQPLIELTEYALIQNVHVKFKHLASLIENHLTDPSNTTSDPKTPVTLKGFLAPETLFESYTPEILDEELRYNYQRRGTARIGETGFKFGELEIILTGTIDYYTAEIYINKRWVASFNNSNLHDNGLFENYKYEIETTQGTFHLDLEQETELTTVFLRQAKLDLGVDNIRVLSYISDPQTTPTGYVNAKLLDSSKLLSTGVLTYANYKEFKALLPASFEQY